MPKREEVDFIVVDRRRSERLPGRNNQRVLLSLHGRDSLPAALAAIATKRIAIRASCLVHARHARRCRGTTPFRCAEGIECGCSRLSSYAFARPIFAAFLLVTSTRLHVAFSHL
jgi:hypothetical protein